MAVVDIQDVVVEDVIKNPDDSNFQVPQNSHLFDNTFFNRVDPNYDSKSAMQKNLGSKVPLASSCSNLHGNTDKNEYKKRPRVEHDFVDNENSKARHHDHNYSNIFSTENGNIGHRTKGGSVSGKQRKSDDQFYMSTTGYMNHPSNTGGDMFKSSVENTLKTSLHGERPKDSSLTTSYRDETKVIRSSFTGLGQIKKEIVSNDTMLRHINNLGGNFYKYKHSSQLRQEGNLVKLNFDNADQVDPTMIRKNIARKGIQVVGISKDYDAITQTDTGRGELQIRVPHNKTLEDVQKDIVGLGLNLEQSHQSAQKNTGFSNQWMHNGAYTCGEVNNHGARKDFASSDARMKRHIEMRSNGDLFGMGN